jgi:hypothetical protein
MPFSMASANVTYNGNMQVAHETRLSVLSDGANQQIYQQQALKMNH